MVRVCGCAMPQAVGRPSCYRVCLMPTGLKMDRSASSIHSDYFFSDLVGRKIKVLRRGHL